MSGHSKWSTIKRKKAATDAKRGKVFTRIAKDLALAAREGGGDPTSNFKLRLAIDRARAANMPKDNIDRAIRRGTGEEKGAAAFEQFYYEGYATHGVALMIEVVTDNRNRSVADVRHQLTRYGGNLGESGSVAWQFERKAYFAFAPEGRSEDDLFDLAVEAGAEDVTFETELVEIIAPVEAFKSVSDSLEAAGIAPDEAELRMEPTNLMQLPPADTIQVMRVIEALEELDDVRNIYSNLDVTEDAMAALEAA
ncbi:MAG: YebC/PmpR family DNA-binding transcriptional regulator [Anaerolineales bacterium]